MLLVADAALVTTLVTALVAMLVAILVAALVTISRAALNSRLLPARTLALPRPTLPRPLYARMQWSHRSRVLRRDTHHFRTCATPEVHDRSS